MSRPVVGGKAFDAASAARKYMILLDGLKRSTAEVRYLTRMVSSGRIARLESAGSGDDDIFAALGRWHPHDTERLQEEMEFLRDAADRALEVFADRAAKDRECELIRHLREDTSGRTPAEIETAKRLADVRERKLEAR